MTEDVLKDVMRCREGVWAAQWGWAASVERVVSTHRARGARCAVAHLSRHFYTARGPSPGIHRGGPHLLQHPERPSWGADH